jgi:predicted nucleic-acid-binding protein
MIALDSNVLLRYLINDGSPQCATAARFVRQELSADVPGFISLPVACEIYWVMSRTYKLQRDVMLEAFENLLNAREIRFEREALVGSVVEGLMSEGSKLDFADMLIHAIGQAEGCVRTVTFDGVFGGVKGVEVLG